ncbi:MAG TPA: T9SS type A sorting domain-containing protein [Bacteroidota bacterium]|nr:T9SS type A sorting domain-containing protein [Bacteroidota bacterium]
MTHHYKYLLFLVLFVFLQPAGRQGYLSAQKIPRPMGVDCECALTGSYVDPDTGVDIAINPDGTSPHGKYKVVVTGTDPIDVQVIRLSDNTKLFEQSVQSDTYWGFSPDDDRFVTHYALGGTDVVTLYDLTINPAHQVWTVSPATTASRFYFSRHGKYFLYEAITGSFQSYIVIVNAVTGVKGLEDSYTFYNIPDSSDQYGLSVHGFSPDTSDRTFTYAYIYSQNNFLWNMVNLSLARIYPSEQHTGISEFWQFSPCGDVLGDVRQIDPGSVDIRLIKTVSGGNLGGSSSYPLAPVSLRSTPVSQIASVGGTDYVLAPNSAGGACLTVPDTLELARHRVIAGTSVPATLFLNVPAGSGGLTVNLSSDASAAASVPASVLVPQDSLSATFTVTTHSVSLQTAAVISAAANGTTKTDTLIVVPQGIASVSLVPAGGVLGGDSAQCTVYLTNPAQSGGQLVTLVNGNSAISSIPPSITISEAAMSGSCTVTTSTVNSLDSTVITAKTSNTAASATLLIAPFATLTIQPDTVVGGNQISVGAVMLVPARSPYQIIQLQSSDTVTVPLSPVLSVPGGYTSAGAVAQTTGVAADTVVSLSITNSPRANSSPVLVRPANLQSTSPQFDLGCLVGAHGRYGNIFIAGWPIRFQVSLDGEAPPPGAPISMSSDHPLVLPPVTPLTIHYRKRDTTWTLTSANTIASPQQVILTLTYRGKSLFDTVIIVPQLHYSVVEFGDSTYYYAALSINNAGKVYGIDASGNYFWDNGTVTRFSSFPGLTLYPSNGPQALNDSGHLVGNVGNHAAYWKPDTTITLPLPPGYASAYGVAINNHDDVIGYADTVACLWSGGGFTILDGFGPKYAPEVDALNNSRQVVGDFTRDYYGYTPGNAAVLWENGHITWSLAGSYLPPYNVPVFAYARTINDSGTIAGEYNIQPAYQGKGWFLRHGADTTNFASLPPYYGMRPLSINAHGDIVGTMWQDDFDSYPYPFLYKDGYYYDLNCITDSIPGGQHLSIANRINDRGIIAGAVRIEALNTTRACLLIPSGTTLAVNGGQRKALPTAYRLHQNFPNPFNPVTMIQYDLPRDSRVTLTVYNILGQSVAVLVDQKQIAGYYSVQFGGPGFSSGVYFYRLTAGTYQSVKKMMLVK